MQVVYVEFNHWSEEYYPNCEPFETWFSYDEKDGFKFRDEEWLIKNKLVVVETLVDMSCNYCITTTKEWLESICPDFFERYSQFVRESEDGKPPYGQFNCPFLEYTEENIGYWCAGWDAYDSWEPKRKKTGEK